MPLKDALYSSRHHVYSKGILHGAQHGFDAEGFFQKQKVLPRFHRALLRAPKIWWQADSLNIPNFKFDIKFKDYQKLQRLQQGAVQSKGILQKYKVFLPASLEVSGKTYRVGIRLKGDALDHISTDKWSLRVHIKKNKALFGMRRFSLQNPSTRDFIGPLLMVKTVDLINAYVIRPRFIFVDVVINGKRWGVMNLEEHFAKELLEYNHRPDSVILKFADKYYMEHWVFGRDWENPVYSSYYTTPIEVVGASRVRRSPVLRNDFRVAAGLLRGFIQGKLKAHQVFDAQQMAAYLAAVDLWGGGHGLIFINIRFYYNPITAKLEPIIFDNELSQRHQYFLPSRVSYLYRLSLSRKILQDPVMRAAYDNDIKKYTQMVRSGAFERQIKNLEKSYYKILGREFYLLEPTEMNYFSNQIKCFSGEVTCNTDAKIAHYIKTKKDLLHALSHALQHRLINLYEINYNSHHYVQLQNMVPFDLKVLDISYRDSGGARHPIQFSKKIKFPFVVSKSKLRLRPALYHYDYKPEVLKHYHIEATIEAIISKKYQGRFGKPAPKNVVAVYYVPVIDHAVLPSTPLSDILKKNPFIHQKKQNLIIQSGHWHVKGNITVPSAYHLIIKPGAHLHFSKQAILLSYGVVSIEGTSSQPVTLEGEGATNWGGLVMLDVDQESLWRHVVVRNTSGVKTPDWSLRGGINFYQSPIKMIDCQFIGNRAEDAVNIVRTKFALMGLQVSDALSDGLDVDFSKGSIGSSQFKAIGRVGGGDAIDVSGSVVQALHIEVQGVMDKGISVGEASHFSGDDIAVHDSTVGVVSKDASVTEIKNLQLDNISLCGLMAYVKKPSFGMPVMIVTRLKLQQVKQLALVQTGAKLSIDGQRQKSSKMADEQIRQYSSAILGSA